MRIGVVSDTHGHVPYTLDAVRMLESLNVELVIHCGDIGSPDIVPLFAAWPTHFVFGNVDHDGHALEAAIRSAGKQCHGRFGMLELAGRRVAFLHGDDTALLRQTTASGEWDLVCHGHTHIARREQQGRTWVLNPGALYRATPHSLAYVELPSLEATIVTV
ncbi:MAG: YfcE family phosphodiesterase [Planctomycetia bacterium 21-64-5]|nr:MAG: YfcE family phosphodiesterase [Planctomycetia bacterium 21-64-5]HQU43146.1 YfcE family phosphodiesterase [Pirellulales bacterium]